MKKFLAATAAAVMCTAAGTYAFAQDAEHHDGKRHMRGASHRMHRDEFGDPARLIEMMTRHLDLDDTQSQTVGNILEAAKPEIDALRERMRTSREAMHGRLLADVYAEFTPEQREGAAAGRNGMRRGFRRHLAVEPE